MKTFSASLALLSAISAAYAQSPLTIISPAAVVQCQPVLLSWSGGSAPYYVSIIPGGQPSAAALQSFPTQSGNSLTWVANLSSGQDITFKIVDSTGDTNYSSQVPIQAGSTTNCAASVSGGGAASSSGPASSAAAAATTSRAPLSSSSMTTSTRASSASSSAPASSSSSSAASTTSVSSGLPAAANSQAASSAPAPTGAASKTVASLAGVAGLAGLVAFLA